MVEPKMMDKRAKTPETKRVPLTARVDGAKSVSVTGEFTGWSEEGIALARGVEGTWQTTLSLAPGEYQYRLRVDGTWRDHSEAQRRIPNVFGSENCVLVVRP